MSLIEVLNKKKGNLVPPSVKKNLCQKFTGQKGLGIKEARDLLLYWAIESMPEIWETYMPHPNSPSQAIDSIQHYRFGFLQAQKLIQLSKTGNFAEDSDQKMVALFTSVHDIGRMMVGSGASVDLYKDKSQGGLLHPVVGAMMIREAFAPLFREQSNEIGTLLNALIATSERHSISTGLPASKTEEQTVYKIEADPYFNYHGPLLLADVSLDKFGKYAHLVAFADLINNADVKLEGVAAYDSLIGLEKMDTVARITYLIKGPGRGEFKVIKKAGETETFVNRSWKNQPEEEPTFNGWVEVMKKNALRFPAPTEIEKSGQAFDIGIERAFFKTDAHQ